MPLVQARLMGVTPSGPNPLNPMVNPMVNLSWLVHWSVLLPLQDIFNGLSQARFETGSCQECQWRTMYLWDANIVHHDMLWRLLSYLVWPVARWQFWMWSWLRPHISQGAGDGDRSQAIIYHADVPGSEPPPQTTSWSLDWFELSARG